ncbi:uncharacterized protein LOC142340223 [Convolutriloba macropyga]|uniref:uncharacterized protein LOC142340223 n=1 Tax=Convolutriloba macropyga TaxID=536237 RepID=UPI003F520441
MKSGLHHVRIRGKFGVVYCLVRGSVGETYINAEGFSVWSGSSFSGTTPRHSARADYRKVRIVLGKCFSYILINDTTYATVTGAEPDEYGYKALYFGSGGDCIYSPFENYKSGEAKVDLSDTEFSLAANANFSYTGDRSVTLEKVQTRKTVHFKGSGICGEGSPSVQDGTEAINIIPIVFDQN